MTETVHQGGVAAESDIPAVVAYRCILSSLDQVTAVREIISLAAIRYGDDVYAAPRPGRHHDVIRAIKATGATRPVAADEQGFLTSRGRFVSRQEAMVIACAAGQITKPTFQPNELFSEDVW